MLTAMVLAFILVPVALPFEYRGRARNHAHRPHRFTTVASSGKYADALVWCEEQFGKEDAHRWYFGGGYQILIHGDDDAFAFRMRWC